MVHRHPTLYKMLGLLFLGLTIALAILGTLPAWSSMVSFTLFSFSLLSLILTLAYFHLGAQEERGF